MSGSINIGANNQDDAFYRYKMPKLVSRIEGRGNGVKTNIVNMVDIAKALARPPTYCLKYFGCELGAQTKFSEDSGNSLVNGSHNSGFLSETLEGFIKKFVQCYSCSNPETVIEVDKRENITLTCKACGHVSNVDPMHKLNTFIIKHPPKNKSSKKKAVDKMRRQDREREELGEALDAQSDKKSKSKRKKDKKEKKSKKDRDGGATDSPRKSDQADADAEEVTEKLSDMCFTPEQKMVISLREMLDEKKSSKEIAKYALNQEAIDGLEARMKIFVETVLGPCSKTLAEYTAKKIKFFKAIAKDETKQLALLSAFELYLGVTKKEYVKETPLVLKVLYDADAAEEEAVLKWHKNAKQAAKLNVPDAVAEAVRKHASPFVTWLEEAEEDSDEESESD